MTITEKLSGIIDFIAGGITSGDDEDVFETMNEEDGIDEEEYVEDGSALRIRKPEYQTKVNNTRELKLANHPSYKGHEVTIMEPRAFSDGEKIVQHLKENKTVILNLHLLDKGLSQRIIDFACGASHALSGKVQKVEDKVFIFTPRSVALSVDSHSQSKFSESLWNKPL